jgi:hypothetical protein
MINVPVPAISSAPFPDVTPANRSMPLVPNVSRPEPELSTSDDPTGLASDASRCVTLPTSSVAPEAIDTLAVAGNGPVAVPVAAASRSVPAVIVVEPE